ncbi:hypothetical protein BDW22DRAFT_618866 [Trametopsis cervina]|nr:hypothetical protein BDW22DRAFT_618866 [Trametopsis cervina]
MRQASMAEKDSDASMIVGGYPKRSRSRTSVLGGTGGRRSKRHNLLSTNIKNQERGHVSGIRLRCGCVHRAGQSKQQPEDRAASANLMCGLSIIAAPLSRSLTTLTTPSTACIVAHLETEDHHLPTFRSFRYSGYRRLQLPVSGLQQTAYEYPREDWNRLEFHTCCRRDIQQLALRLEDMSGCISVRPYSIDEYAGSVAVQRRIGSWEGSADVHPPHKE